MGISSDQKETLVESINALFEARINNCGYYGSSDYDEIHSKTHQLDRSLRKKLGKKRFKQIWNEYYWLDALHGQEISSLEKSVYRRGFSDALFLLGEIERAKNGQKSIFS